MQRIVFETSSVSLKVEINFHVLPDSYNVCIFLCLMKVCYETYFVCFGAYYVPAYKEGIVKKKNFEAFSLVLLGTGARMSLPKSHGFFIVTADVVNSKIEM